MHFTGRPTVQVSDLKLYGVASVSRAIVDVDRISTFNSIFHTPLITVYCRQSFNFISLVNVRIIIIIIIIARQQIMDIMQTYQYMDFLSTYTQEFRTLIIYIYEGILSSSSSSFYLNQATRPININKRHTDR